MKSLSQLALACLLFLLHTYGTWSTVNRTEKALRLEYIQSMILEKLHLAAPPNISKNNLLPEFLKKRIIAEMTDKIETPIQKKVYRNNIDHIVIRPENTTLCDDSFDEQNITENTKRCFQYQLSDDLTKFNIISARLLMKLNAVENDTICTVSAHIYTDIDIDSSEVLHIQNSTDLGVIEFNVTEAVQGWILKGELLNDVTINCNKYYEDSESTRPVLIVRKKSKIIVSSRKERNVCDDNNRKCCKRDLTVNFDEIGWTWVISPASFNAGYCEGECTSTNRSRIFRPERSELNNASMCCAPVFKTCPLIYHEERGNVTEIKKYLVNIEVKQCECL